MSNRKIDRKIEGSPQGLPDPTLLPTTPRDWVILARDAVRGLDPELVWLELWRDPITTIQRAREPQWTPDNGCGMLACAGGHLCAHPAFRAAGLYYDTDHMTPRLRGDTVVSGATALMRLMGLSLADAWTLFRPRARHEAHIERGNDAALFVHRCNDWLANHDEGTARCWR